MPHQVTKLQTEKENNNYEIQRVSGIKICGMRLEFLDILTPSCIKSGRKIKGFLN
jgi:hypothetical protein